MERPAMVRLFRWINFVCCAAVPCAAIAEEVDGPVRKLLVGTRHVPPFAIKKADATWEGISIELWREIAAENHWDFEFREFDLEQLLGRLEKGELDAAVAAVTVTPEREKLLDFTHPFYSSGLGIAVRKSYRHN
jgi:ABC-type amino acid transport substrate-binding protein